MTDSHRGIHGQWVSRWTFILAATGSAVGLGNIWKFPYITGENGGGAFVVLYLLCILVAGIPVMMAEVLIGRKGRMSPIHTMQHLSREYAAPRVFRGVGWLGAVAGFFILSFYSVIAGWTLAYVAKIASGEFLTRVMDISQVPPVEMPIADQVTQSFTQLLANPWMLVILHSCFMVLTGIVIARGVQKGLEKSLRLLMPLLFIMLIALFLYSLTTSGFAEGWQFLFSFDASKLDGGSVVVALGHAFFTLSLGMGAIMAYGAYMPGQAPLGRTVMTVAVLDTLVALVAGLIIFSVVFSNGLQPDAGPGLLFKTLPIAFAGLPGGTIIGTAFFVLVAIAAWSSAISIAEPAVAWAVEKGFGRITATMVVCGFAWFLGLGTVLSFNDWGDYQILVSVTGTLVDTDTIEPLAFFWWADVAQLREQWPSTDVMTVAYAGSTFFNAMEYVSANIMMPLGGVFIAVFVGWFMTREAVMQEARLRHPQVFAVWYFVLRYISPVAVFYIFIIGLR